MGIQEDAAATEKTLDVVPVSFGPEADSSLPSMPPTAPCVSTEAARRPTAGQDQRSFSLHGAELAEWLPPLPPCCRSRLPLRTDQWQGCGVEGC